MVKLAASPLIHIVALGSIAKSVAAGQALEFNATFSTKPEPFSINVNEEFITLTKSKVSSTRYVVDVEQPDWSDGPPVHNASSVGNYWAKQYNWSEVQSSLNSKYKQYTTTVTAQPNSDYTDPVQLHFVHHRSNRSDAIPLIFIHGWPGSFLEVGPIIDALTHPSNSSAPAFHVVAPSIPGFGFSPAPTKLGFGPRAASESFNNLMVEQLNYTSYVVAGGDIGGFILPFMAGDHPESVVSVLCNFWLVQPTTTDLQRYEAGLSTPDEVYLIQEFWKFEHLSSGYRFEQQTQPLQLGHSLGDSPVGFAMWIYTFMHNNVQSYVWSPETLITWTMMYWIQGPYSGLRWYKEMVNDNVLENGLLILDAGLPYIHQPVAISEFPADIWYRTPLDWAQRRGNVVRRTIHDVGGHFPTIEVPEIFVEDIRNFFGNGTLSKTDIFGV